MSINLLRISETYYVELNNLELVVYLKLVGHRTASLTGCYCI